MGGTSADDTEDFQLLSDQVSAQAIMDRKGITDSATTLNNSTTIDDFIQRAADLINYILNCTGGVNERIIDFEISGISDASSTTTAAIADAIDSVLFESADPLGTGKIYLSDLSRAIGDVSGTAGFILVSPSANIEPGVGELAVRGEVNYT